LKDWKAFSQKAFLIDSKNQCLTPLMLNSKVVLIKSSVFDRYKDSKKVAKKKAIFSEE
jgi:hypothetical protein